MASLRDESGAASLVTAVLVMPLLVLSLAAVLHLGIYLLSRQVAVTAVQQGLTVATAANATTGQGIAVTRDFIDDHSTASIVAVTSTPATAPTITITARIITPAVVPGLTRTITVTQTATRERWIEP